MIENSLTLNYLSFSIESIAVADKRYLEKKLELKFDTQKLIFSKVDVKISKRCQNLFY